MGGKGLTKIVEPEKTQLEEVSKIPAQVLRLRIQVIVKSGCSCFLLAPLNQAPICGNPRLAVPRLAMQWATNMSTVRVIRSHLLLCLISLTRLYNRCLDFGGLSLSILPTTLKSSMPFLVATRNMS